MLTSVENHHSSQQNDGGVIDSSSSKTYSEDIESEANSYFQRMLAEQHSIDDEMVQMLTRFKKSSIKREQSIFDCMISNLLEEYMFLPKYPEKQLELAAILFGCIIKHKLVTDLPLAVALRCVLDALRKPADSKTFAFGTKALEQFISRLEEWPQYCNHILQISHLRSTHPKVVEYIDGVLARKSHGGNGNMSSLGTTVNELIGSNSSQPGQQLSSSLLLDPLQSAFVEDGTKASTTTNSFTKPPIAASVQPTATSSSSADSVSLPKLQSAPGGVLSISSGLSRIQGSTTRFGSALNIETLEAAAERRETPVESIVPKMGEYGGENVTNCYEDEKTIKNVGKSEVTESEPWLSTDDNAPRLDQDGSANRAWPLLLSANKDANGRGIRMRRDTTTRNYGKASLSTSDEFAVDSARPRSSINESIHERWTSDSALPGTKSQSLGNENWRMASLCSARMNHSLMSSTDATPRNYGRMPLITDFYADNVRPLPSVNEDAYGGGVRMSGFTATTHNYDMKSLIRENISSNRDATPRNYGRTPLIMDFYADNVRPLPSVNEDVYGGGGGGVRMSGFTATTPNYGMQPLIRENISSNSVRPLPPVANDEKASLISDEFAVINITRPLSSINDPLYEWWDSDLEAAKPQRVSPSTPNNYGKAPMIVDSYEGCEASNTGRGSLHVHPTQQKSTRLENSSFGSCFPWFRKRMQSGLLKK